MLIKKGVFKIFSPQNIEKNFPTKLRLIQFIYHFIITA